MRIATIYSSFNSCDYSYCIGVVNHVAILFLEETANILFYYAVVANHVATSNQNRRNKSRTYEFVL